MHNMNMRDWHENDVVKQMNVFIYKFSYIFKNDVNFQKCKNKSGGNAP